MSQTADSESSLYKSDEFIDIESFNDNSEASSSRSNQSQDDSLHSNEMANAEMISVSKAKSNEREDECSTDETGGHDSNEDTMSDDQSSGNFENRFEDLLNMIVAKLQNQVNEIGPIQNLNDLREEIAEIKRDQIAHINDMRNELTKFGEMQYSIREELVESNRYQAEALNDVRKEVAEIIAKNKRDQIAHINDIRNELTKFGEMQYSIREELVETNRYQVEALNDARKEVAEIKAVQDSITNIESGKAPDPDGTQIVENRTESADASTSNTTGLETDVMIDPFLVKYKKSLIERLYALNARILKSRTFLQANQEVINLLESCEKVEEENQALFNRVSQLKSDIKKERIAFAIDNSHLGSFKYYDWGEKCDSTRLVKTILEKFLEGKPYSISAGFALSFNTFLKESSQKQFREKLKQQIDDLLGIEIQYTYNYGNFYLEYPDYSDH